MKNPTQAQPLPSWAAKIKQLRQSLKQSQAEFGLRFGVSKQAVSFWEHGVYEPPADVLLWVMEQKVGKQ